MASSSSELILRAAVLKLMRPRRAASSAAMRTRAGSAAGLEAAGCRCCRVLRPRITLLCARPPAPSHPGETHPVVLQPAAPQDAVCPPCPPCPPPLPPPHPPAALSGSHNVCWCWNGAARRLHTCSPHDAPAASSGGPCLHLHPHLHPHLPAAPSPPCCPEAGAVAAAWPLHPRHAELASLGHRAAALSTSSSARCSRGSQQVVAGMHGGEVVD
jgi:hypothetical protein